MKYFLLLIIIIVTGCEYKKTCYVCDKEQREKVADFVSKNIKNANNMSDEEMEDVIKELRTTAIITYCDQRLVTVDRKGNVKWEQSKRDTNLTYFPYIY